MILHRRASSTSNLHTLLLGALILVSAVKVFGQEKNAPVQNPKPTGDAVQSAGEGRVFESPEGGFRIRLPKDFRDPVKQNRELKKEGYSFPAFLSLSDRGVLTIVPFDPPAGLENSLGIQRSAAKAEMGNLGVTSQRERILDRKGEVGIEVYAKGRFQTYIRFVRFRFIAATHRWYELAFVSVDVDNRDLTDITAALESFEILPEGETRPAASNTPDRLTFEAPDGSFKLDLPTGFQLPIDQTAQVGSRIQHMKASQFLSSGPTGLLILSRLSEIRGMNTKVQISQFREGMTIGLIQTVKGRIIKSKPVIRGGLACQELRFTGEIEGQLMNGRGLIFAKKGEVLSILFLSPSNEALDSVETDGVFDSIKWNP